MVFENMIVEQSSTEPATNKRYINCVINKEDERMECTLEIICWIQWSSGLGESNDIGTFSEAFSTEHQVVFADETHLACALSAFSAVLSVFSRVSSPK